MVKEYIPKKGDLVILSKEPALIVSNEVFNQHVGLAIACPITNTDRNFPFHVKVDSKQFTGFIMTEQIKSIDYKVRKVKFVEKVSDEVLDIVESVVF